MMGGMAEQQAAPGLRNSAEVGYSTDFKEPRKQAKPKIRKLVTLPVDTTERVERFRLDHGIADTSTAMARLIAAALADLRRRRIADLLNGKN